MTANILSFLHIESRVLNLGCIDLKCLVRYLRSRRAFCYRGFPGVPPLCPLFLLGLGR